MKQNSLKRLRIGWIILTGAILFRAASVHAAGQNGYLSPTALVADSSSKHLFIAEKTTPQIAIFDLASEKVTATIPLPEPPHDLVLDNDNQTLYVAGGTSEGKIYVIDAKQRKISDTLDVGHTPSAVALDPAHQTLYACLRFNNQVAIIDAATKKVTARIGVTREPVAAALTPDGNLLLVANLLPAGPADGAYAAAAVSVIDTREKKIAATIQLPNGSQSVRDVCCSPDGKYAYFSHILSRYQLPTTQLERGWMNTNAVSVIDVVEKKLVNTVLLDDVDLGAANPWGIACTSDGKTLCVTHAGTGELSVINRKKLHDKLAQAQAGAKMAGYAVTGEDVPNILSFLVDLRRRIKLTGSGTRDLAIVGTQAYITEYFTDSLGLVDIRPDIRPKPRSIALGPKTPLTPARQGEMFFHDASLCFQKWQSCSSCHPGARSDGLNWDLLNDGIGNPKSSKSLLFAHQTPPAMITGIRDRAEIAVRAGIRYIQFAVRPEEDADALDAYLKSLKPVPSPHLIKGQLSPAAHRGQQVFQKADCEACHTGPLHTDLKKYNVGTGRDREANLEFDTPTLVEIWRSAPYLYDGRAVTIRDVLTQHNQHNQHGKTSDLTPGEIADLTEFVLSQ